VLVRNPSGAAARSLYLANDAVTAVTTHNAYERLRLTAAGTKVFAKQEGSGKPVLTISSLPSDYRVANTLNTMIKELHVPTLSNVVFEDQPIPPPVQIPWYPDGLAWQFNVPKKVLRKSPEFKKFHSFLVFETEVVSCPIHYHFFPFASFFTSTSVSHRPALDWSAMSEVTV
jgi:hypothetical protein